MTTSQIKSGIGFAALIVSTAGAVALPHLERLPEKYKPAVTIFAALVAAASGVVMLTNQSWNPNHVSIPVRKAKELGIAKEQTGQK